VLLYKVVLLAFYNAIRPEKSAGKELNGSRRGRLLILGGPREWGLWGGQRLAVIIDKQRRGKY